MKLRIADDFSLSIDAATQTFAILAKRGVGKTYTASVMAEEFLRAGQQGVPFLAGAAEHTMIVIPQGKPPELVGLRSSQSARSARSPRPSPRRVLARKSE